MHSLDKMCTISHSAAFSLFKIRPEGRALPQNLSLPPIEFGHYLCSLLRSWGRCYCHLCELRQKEGLGHEAVDKILQLLQSCAHPHGNMRCAVLIPSYFRESAECYGKSAAKPDGWRSGSRGASVDRAARTALIQLL